MSGLEWDILGACLRHSGGYQYKRRDPIGEGQHNCSTFAYAVLLDVFGEAVKPKIRELHLSQGGRWANIAALGDLGLGYAVDHPVAARWHYVQGWNEHDGHTSLYFEAPAGPLAGRALVAQASGPDAPWHVHRTWVEHRARWDQVRAVVLTGA